MKNKKTLCALFLTGTMIMGMATTAFAAEIEGTTIPTVGDGTVSITKNYEVPEGVRFPSAGFSFTATKITEDAPDATIESITFDQLGETPLVNNKYTISKSQQIEFEAFPHAGVYEYNVSENAGDAENVFYDDKVYKMRVYVENQNDGTLLVTKITASLPGRNEGYEIKQSAILFTNTYTKNATLTITKNTVSPSGDGNLDFADKTKSFPFAIKFIPSGTSNQTQYTGTIHNADGETTFTAGTTLSSFTLADGDTLVFENLPVGTRYVVTEIGAEDGYTPSVEVIENGVTTVKNHTFDENKDAPALADGSNSALVGEGTNSVTFTNTYKDISITGVVTNNMPFIVLISLGVCALGLVVLSKKRRFADR